MNTEQFIWFIDSRFFYQTTSLDKLVQLIPTHQKTLKIIIDASAQIKGRGYWHLFNEKEILSEELMAKILLKEQQLLKYFKMNAINVEITINQASDYLKTLKNEIVANVSNVVVIEDQTLQHRHSIFQKLTDIPAPILLLNHKPWKHSTNIVAAVDPLHEHARSGRIDQHIVSFAEIWSQSLKTHWMLVHCYQMASVSSSYKNKILSIHRDGFNDFAKKQRVPPSQCALLEGLPEIALASYIKKNNARLLIMGLVARNKLEELWVGSTTTALLTEIPCDILFVKE